jgi:hypothetical protein
LIMDARLHGLFDELEKIGYSVGERLVASLMPTSLGRAQRLAVVHGAGGRISKGKARHRQMMDAVEHNYPASWVPLGMRPSE